jgi:hypothetical protein
MTWRSAPAWPSAADGRVPYGLVPDFTDGDSNNLAAVAAPGARLNLDDDLGATTNGPVEPGDTALPTPPFLY